MYSPRATCRPLCSIGLGLKAIERGYRVLFTTAAAMIATLTQGLAGNRLEDKLKLYTIPRLLTLMKSTFCRFTHWGQLALQLISRRYEKGPMILTSNQSFGAWGEVFGDRVLATATGSRPSPCDHNQYPWPMHHAPTFCSA